MNNVIEQLKAQATEDVMGVPVLNAEMFAELIVKECTHFNYDFLESYREACEVNDKIRKHFGVE